MKLNKKIKRFTHAGFKKLYMENTVNALAKVLGCSRGAVLYHAKKQGLTGIKKSGCARKISIADKPKT